MRVHKLYRYPVKSLGGQSVTSLTPEIGGFADDRRWCFIDQRNNFIGQRRFVSLTHFRAEVHDDALRFIRLEDEALVGAVAGARTGNKQSEVTVWDDTFPATLIESDQLEMITEELGIPGARLLYMGTGDSRPVDARYAKAGEEVSFADGYPYLITTTASLADLSRRVDEDLDERRFRPNIIVYTTQPFAEDDWARLQVGHHQFRLPKPCARCIMITQHPDSGDRNPRVLAELAAYRKVGRKVMFGMNACWEGGEGTLKVGDEVKVRFGSSNFSK
jgi:uncharacterized protein YcbX